MGGTETAVKSIEIFADRDTNFATRLNERRSPRPMSRPEACLRYDVVFCSVDGEKNA